MIRPFACSAMIVSYKSRRRHQHIDGHENDQAPSQDMSCDSWNLFDPARHTWIQYFDPHYGRDTPEKTIEQIDSSAQIERNTSIVPKDTPKKEFGKDAA